MTWIPEPSFSRSIARAGRDREYPVSRLMLDKTSGRRLLEALDAPVPSGFEEIGELASLTPARLSKPTAVKPLRGSNNRGLLALVPGSNSTWRELASGRRLTFAEIADELAYSLLRDGIRDAWVVEDLIRDAHGRLVDDVKLLMFRGRLGAAFVRRNHDRAFRWFDAEWRPLDPGLSRHPIDPTIPPPGDRALITGLAERISAALPIPFVRVDVYSTPTGPVVGELTPFPGWAHDLAPAVDLELGRRYEAAESELLDLGMDWATVAPAAVSDLLSVSA